MVVAGREEVCRIFHNVCSYSDPSVVFELQEVELIPFRVSADPQKEY